LVLTHTLQVNIKRPIVIAAAIALFFGNAGYPFGIAGNMIDV
jgi:hypothetical protein